MLKEAEAKASNLFKGELQTLEACEHHFHSWRRQHRERERLETELPATAVLVQLDYAENLTIPVGPVEEQSWFWATARLSASVLCFCVRFWEDGKLRSLYLNYVSQILDHTALHAALALKDVGHIFPHMLSWRLPSIFWKTHHGLLSLFTMRTSRQRPERWTVWPTEEVAGLVCQQVCDWHSARAASCVEGGCREHHDIGPPTSWTRVQDCPFSS